MTSKRSIQQASKLLDVVYIVPLSKDEARALADSIRGHLSEMDAQILELKEREGWKALGYTSWRECIQNEFNIGQSRAYQLLSAARVRRNIAQVTDGKDSTIVEKPVLTEEQARELSKLKSAEEQRSAYDEALGQSNGKPTTTVVERVVKQKRVEAVFRQGEVVLHVPTGLRCTVASVLPDGTYRLKPMVSGPLTRSIDWSQPVSLDDIAMGKAGVAVKPTETMEVIVERALSKGRMQMERRELCKRLLDEASDTLVDTVLHLLRASVVEVA